MASRIPFENIQSDHTIEVTYQEIPSFEVKANVTGGTVSETSGSVYRDQAYTVAYEANKDYKLGYIIVDGRFMWGSELNQHLTGYTFENVQGGHEITVFFYYKYIPYLLWAVLASGVLFILHMTWLHPASRRRRKMKRYYRKHRRIRKQLEEKHVEMGAESQSQNGLQEMRLYWKKH